MKKQILILAAHPDDEVLGCGGTISKFSEKYSVSAVFMTNGVSARNYKNKKIESNLIKKRKQAAEKSCKKPIFFNFPDNSVECIPILEIIKKTEKIINKLKPEIIFTHRNSDLNIEHQLTNKAVMTATRPIKKNSVKQILFFEILSSSEWNLIGKNDQNKNSNWFEDISKTIKIKLKAIKVYKRELKKWLHPRSVEGIISLAKNRGGTLGYFYA